VLVVAGREDRRYDAARRRATELELVRHIRWMPDVPDDDVPALLGGAMVFVFPSLHEGFGFPPLEAMACGTPVICSNRTSLPEVVGDAGLLVAPEPAALAAGIGQLLASPDLRAGLRARGLRRAPQFSWERTARTMLDVYRGVGNGG
jgi:glycosyltransferase involved in cell wall biosynthesis